MPAQGGSHLTARRERLLARTRRLTVLVTGSALAGAVALGAAFAQALPGHAATAASPAGQHPAQPRPGGGSARPHRRHRAVHAGQRHQQLRPAASPPAATTSPPSVTSGGS
ncbi:MAG TPA: hypothetical protein VGI64_11935 [Streptosporangiaceae bacterium]